MRRGRATTRARRSKAIVDGCLDQFSDDEIELFTADVGRRGQRPLNWNVLTVDSRVPERVTAPARGVDDRGRRPAGGVVALTMPVLVPMNMSFLTYCALFMLPGWSEVMSLPVPERIEQAARPRDPRSG